MFKLDWNDARFLLAVARGGSFRKASSLTGVDMATISRRIADLERRLGTTLFVRGKKGVVPTETGDQLIQSTERLADGMREYAQLLAATSGLRRAHVRIASTPGITNYHLIPAFAGLLPPGHAFTEGARAIDPETVPSTVFLAPGDPTADIEIFWMPKGQPPANGAGDTLTFLGFMRMLPMASQRFLATATIGERFEDLAEQPLLAHAQGVTMALEPWNELLAKAKSVREFLGYSDLQHALKLGLGVSLLPIIVPLTESDIQPVEVPSPEMGTDLWIVGRRPSMRVPEVRQVYSLLVKLFSSPLLPR